MHNMSVRVTFSYRLGKMSVEARPKRRRSIDNDDLKDGGDGGGGMDGGGGGQAAVDNSAVAEVLRHRMAEPLDSCRSSHGSSHCKNGNC